MTYGLAHVILLNDSVEHVVAEPCDTPANLSVAVEKMRELQIAYFVKNRWSFGSINHVFLDAPYSPAWHDYAWRCHWHIRTVGMS